MKARLGLHQASGLPATDLEADTKQCVGTGHTLLILSQRLRATFEASTLSRPLVVAAEFGSEDGEIASTLCLWTLLIGMLATYRRSNEFDWMQTEARKLLRSLSFTSRDEALAKLHDSSPAGSLPEGDFVDMVLQVFEGVATGAIGSYIDLYRFQSDSNELSTPNLVRW